MYLGSSNVAEASMSAASDLLGATSSITEDSFGANSQKMPLLEAPLSSNSAESSTTVESALALVSDPVSNPEISTKDTNNDVSSPRATNEIANYKVVSGDTISGIAQKNGISVNTVLWANNLKRDSKLSIGENLVILPISGVKYVVKKGDTLQAIALKYKGDTQEIISYNGLSDDQLIIGDTIMIPDGEISVAATAIAATPAPTPKPVSIVKKVADAALGIGVAHADTSDTEGDTPAVTTNTAISSGYYDRPIKGGIKTQGLHGYNAVDLADACGTPIYASAAGKVVVAKDSGYNGGYGEYLVLSHGNGSQTLYGHMSKLLVGEDTQVTQGQEIGLIGNTGKVAGVTGCHVHFEIRNGPVNPF